MTTPEEIYRTALEHIRDGSDAVCMECGWMGHEEETSGFDSDYCPECFSKEIRTGADEIAAYALEQGEKGE